MKSHSPLTSNWLLIGAATTWTVFQFCLAPTQAQAQQLNDNRQNLSLKMELHQAIDRGIDWLKTEQKADGHWSDPDHPALTALVLTACMGEPTGELQSDPPEFIRKGYEFLLSRTQPDGGIYAKNLRNYNTSISLMALLSANNPDYDPVIRKARNFVVGQQNDFGEKGEIDNPLDGGIGYGGSRDHADMGNTTAALEALYYSRDWVKDHPDAGMQELNWDAAIRFIERSQNLPSHNDQPWASDDPQNRGGFVYYPGFSQAGEMKLDNGRTALRSYGSISYAGLLSYIYADLEKNDPRVQAVFDWLQENYTLEENPGMGQQGLYFYFHTMAKALSNYGVDNLETDSGDAVLWRQDLGKQLLNLQNAEGCWVNTNGRWMEKDPVLVTAYCLLALEFAAQEL